VMSTASNSSLKQSCSVLTSVTSALEVIFNVMRSINPRFTYLLAYLNEQLDRERRYIFTRKAGIDR